jgi:hypothetical protein
MKSIVALLACAALAGGCDNVTYHSSTLPPNGVVHEGTSHFFVFGLVGDEVIPAYQMCPGGVSSVHTELSFGDLVLTVITFGIYTPRSYEVACGGGR